MPFRNPIVGTKVLIREAIESDNYVPGVSGWTIRRDGFAEFLDVVIRGILEIYNSLGQLVISAGYDTDPPYFGAYIALLDPSTGIPRILLHVPEPGNTPFLLVGDATGGYVRITPGTGFGASIEVQPVASGATVSPAVVQGAESLPGLVNLEIYSPENTQHALGVRSLIQLFSGYQFSQRSKIVHTADRNEFLGRMISFNMRPVSFFSATATAIASTTYVPLAGGGVTVEVTIPVVESGCITVKIACRGSNTSAGVPAYTSFEVRENTVAGTVLRAAQDLDLQHQDCNGSRFGCEVTLTGLPVPGNVGGVTDYYVRMMHRVPSGTGTYEDRRLIVKPEF